MAFSSVLSSLHHKDFSVGKKTHPEPRIEKDGTRYKIYISKESKETNNIAGSKAEFFYLTMVLQTKGFWK